MANVVDPNSWRMVPLPDSHPSKLLRSSDSRFELAAETGNPAVGRLAAALQRTFGAASDRVVWRLQGTNSEQQLRIDSSHGFAHTGAVQSDSTLHAVDAGPPWLVLVQTAQELASENGSPEMRTALEQDARLLLVICGVREAGLPAVGPRQLAERVASRLHLRYREPVSLDTDEDLIGLLADVKHSGDSSVLYFDTASAPPPPHFSSADLTNSGASSLEQTYHECAIESLQELEAADSSVVHFSSESEIDDTVILLTRCQSLAAAGRHPCLLLPLDEALAHLPVIRRLVADGDLGITLVIEAGNKTQDLAHSSQLSAFRELPRVRILAPKDGIELGQMLAWCTRQNTPAIVWLAERDLPEVSWPWGEEVDAGRAERLGAGADVAIVAWGSTSAAAAIAAENLAQLQIRATVVNARFAHPLDVECIASAAAEAAYTVILDDCEAGGFSAWVCEQLIRRGSAPNMTIVSPGAVESTGAKDVHQALADLIVLRCRWLGDHLAQPNEIEEVAIARIDPAAATCQGQSHPEPAVLLTELAGIPDVQSQVLATQFSPFIADWVERYGRVGSRDVYLWRWCLHGLDLTTLSCVAPALRRDLCDTKLLAVMYGVMLDDVADHAGGDAFLAALTGIIAGRADRDFSAFSSQQQEYAQFTCDLWDTFRNRLQCAPCYAEYTELLDYDHQQILNTFAYSLMVNKQPALLNVQEHDMYQPHNMQMMSFATMDLMWSPDFDRAELGRLREVVWHAQNMGRIGNLVSTWQREIADRDFTSGVFARALREGDLSLNDLASATPDKIEAAVRRGEHEKYFLLKWEAHRQSISSLAAGIRSIDVAALLRALAQLLRMELKSRGFK